MGKGFLTVVLALFFVTLIPSGAAGQAAGNESNGTMSLNESGNISIASFPSAYISNPRITSPSTIKTNEPVTASAELKDSFPGQWLMMNMGLDLLETYEIRYTVRLNYLYGICPACWWADFSPVKERDITHRLTIWRTGQGNPSDKLFVYRSEYGTTEIYSYNPRYPGGGEDWAESLMNSLDDAAFAYLGVENSGWTYAVTITARGYGEGILGGTLMNYQTPWANSYANPKVINVKAVCDYDFQCPSDELLGDPYCSGGDVWQKQRDWYCANPGTNNAECKSTTSARLKDDCTSREVCEDGKCRTITCFSNSECGTDGIVGGRYCDNDNDPSGYYNGCKDRSGFNCAIYERYRTWTCYNKGTSSSYCNTLDTGLLVEDCLGCSYGECINCYSDPDCPDAGWYGNPHCSQHDDNVWDDYGTGACKNPGEASSYCTQHYEVELKEDCGTSGCPVGEYYCQGGDVHGTCYDRWCSNAACHENSYKQKIEDCGEDSCDSWGPIYCRDNDEYRSRGCYDRGCAYGSCLNVPWTDEEKVRECGTSGYGQPYCLDNDVFRDYTERGCSGDSCYSSLKTEKSKECGSDYCEDWQADYCKGDDVYHSRRCHDKGCSGGGCYESTSTEEGLVESCEQGCENGECRAGVEGDVNGDCRVDIFDLAAVGLAYGSRPGDPEWNENADLNGDGETNIFDLAAVGLNYGNAC